MLVFRGARVVRVGVIAGALTSALAPVAATASTAGLQPPAHFQTATKCVGLWNDSTLLASRAAVARLRPIMAMVVGAGVPHVDATPRCGVMVMASNGSWYATQTSSLKRSTVTWSPLVRLADPGTAQRYNVSNGDPRIVRFAHALPTGRLRLN